MRREPSSSNRRAGSSTRPAQSRRTASPALRLRTHFPCWPGGPECEWFVSPYPLPGRLSGAWGSVVGGAAGVAVTGAATWTTGPLGVAGAGVTGCGAGVGVGGFVGEVGRGAAVGGGVGLGGFGTCPFCFATGET